MENLKPLLYSQVLKLLDVYDAVVETGGSQPLGAYHSPPGGRGKYTWVCLSCRDSDPGGMGGARHQHLSNRSELTADLWCLFISVL